MGAVPDVQQVELQREAEERAVAADLRAHSPEECAVERRAMETVQVVEGAGDHEPHHPLEVVHAEEDHLPLLERAYDGPLKEEEQARLHKLLQRHHQNGQCYRCRQRDGRADRHGERQRFHGPECWLQHGYGAEADVEGGPRPDRLQTAICLRLQGHCRCRALCLLPQEDGLSAFVARVDGVGWEVLAWRRKRVRAEDCALAHRHAGAKHTVVQDVGTTADLHGLSLVLVLAEDTDLRSKQHVVADGQEVRGRAGDHVHARPPADLGPEEDKDEAKDLRVDETLQGLLEVVALDEGAHDPVAHALPTALFRLEAWPHTANEAPLREHGERDQRGAVEVFSKDGHGEDVGGPVALHKPEGEDVGGDHGQRIDEEEQRHAHEHPEAGLLPGRPGGAPLEFGNLPPCDEALRLLRAVAHEAACGDELMPRCQVSPAANGAVGPCAGTLADADRLQHELPVAHRGAGDLALLVEQDAILDGDELRLHEHLFGVDDHTPPDLRAEEPVDCVDRGGTEEVGLEVVDDALHDLLAVEPLEVVHREDAV
mmetsp:Transcript_83252/g.263009  ORF Transcript_83252/g.263009 Transcript_83252/m.263009 type:complete len:541 (+) Transcript_83252:426-2048(+)